MYCHSGDALIGDTESRGDQALVRTGVYKTHPYLPFSLVMNIQLL